MLPGVTPPYESLNTNDNSIVTLATSGSSAAYESIHLLDNKDGADHYDLAETVEAQDDMDTRQGPYSIETFGT